MQMAWCNPTSCVYACLGCLSVICWTVVTTNRWMVCDYIHIICTYVCMFVCARASPNRQRVKLSMQAKLGITYTLLYFLSCLKQRIFNHNKMSGLSLIALQQNIIKMLEVFDIFSQMCLDRHNLCVDRVFCLWAYFYNDSYRCSHYGYYFLGPRCEMLFMVKRFCRT